MDEISTNEQGSRRRSGVGEYLALGSLLVAAITVAIAGSAGAQDAGSITAMATTAGASLTPVILGVGAALVVVNGTFFGVRWVLRAIRGGGRG